MLLYTPIKAGVQGEKKRSEIFFIFVLFWTILDGIIVPLEKVKKQYPHITVLYIPSEIQGRFIYPYIEQPFLYSIIYSSTEHSTHRDRERNSKGRHSIQRIP